MATIPATAEQVQQKTSPLSSSRLNADHLVLMVMEGLLLGLICLSPWGYGCVHPGFEFLLDVGIAVLLILWAVRGLLQGEFSWRKCPVALCLAAFFMLAVAQLVPLPKDWLSRLSPGTTSLYARLLPDQGEILRAPGGGEVLASNGPTSTISLVPGATQQAAIRLLAIFLLFVLVRNNLTSTAQLRRLSIVALINGFLLSLFALIQFFTYGPHLLYGLYPTDGTAFGPFICRNHFPYYVNMCLGLGIGLFLSYFGGVSISRHRSSHSSSKEQAVEASRGRSRRSSRHRSKGPIQYATEDGESEGVIYFLGRLLQQPRTLWFGFVAAILAASIIFSLSRGGALALMGGAVVCVLIQVRRSASFLRLGIGALVVGLAATGFLAWFGVDQLEQRWQLLFDTEEDIELTSRINRLVLWSANLPAFLDFPVWGTGYGTFEFTELLHRDDTKLEGKVAEHAHNDYLEALLEGGIVGLIPLVLLVGLLLWYGYRAVQRQHRSSAGWMATGLFFGVATVLIHSFVDFGLHIPAITFLATVLCAHLAALGSRESGRHAASTSQQGEAVEDTSSLRWKGLAPVAAAGLMGVFALVLVQQGWKAHKAVRLRVAASRLSEGVDRPDRQRQIAYLQAAVQEAPKVPSLHVQLARAQLKLYDEEARKEKDKGMQLALTQGASDLAGSLGSPAGLLPAAVYTAAFYLQEDHAWHEIERKLDVPLLMPALASYVQTRDSCPIMTEPHVRLAASADKLVRGDSTVTYLDRAKFLSPMNATIWYLCGKQEFLSEQWDDAWTSWRHSLELADLHLLPILDQAHSVLSDEEMLKKVFPDMPKVLFVAGMYLQPNEAGREGQKLFLEKALSALNEQEEPSKDEEKGENLFLKGMINDILGQKKDAITAYQAALVHPPKDKEKEINWRLSYARLLYEEGQLKEAERQLRTVLSQQPGNDHAKTMLKVVGREKAKQIEPLAR
jgi:hypothetical protein